MHVNFHGWMNAHCSRKWTITRVINNNLICEHWKCYVWCAVYHIWWSRFAFVSPIYVSCWFWNDFSQQKCTSELAYTDIDYQPNSSLFSGTLKEFTKFAEFSHLTRKPSLFVCVSLMVITYRHRKEIWNENNDNSSKSRQSSIGSQVHVHARFHDKKFVVFYARMLLLCQIFTLQYTLLWNHSKQFI